MKVLGNTPDGDLIIQVSQAEWKHLQEKPQATIYEIEWDTLEYWQGEFLNGLKKLNLSARVHNAIERAAQIRTTKAEKIDGQYTQIQTDPYLISRWTFQLFGDSQLLGFEQWCDCYLTHPDDMFTRNIGDKGKGELLQAIREYRSKEVTNGNK